MGLMCTLRRGLERSDQRVVEERLGCYSSYVFLSSSLAGEGEIKRTDQGVGKAGGSVWKGLGGGEARDLLDQSEDKKTERVNRVTEA
jgi:hypothetical protein